MGLLGQGKGSEIDNVEMVEMSHSRGQTVKFFNVQRTLAFSPKNCAEEILSQTICARILMLNTAFAPRSPFQPYSKSPLPQLSLALFLSMLHQPSKRSKGARTVLKPLHSGQKQNLQAFF